MSKEYQNIDDLLGKYLAGEASDFERREVSEWLNQSEDNLQYFKQVKIIFEKAALVSDFPQFDTDSAWTKVRSAIRKETRGGLGAQRGRSLSMWYQMAAAVIIVFGVAWYLMRSGPAESPYAATEVIAESTALADTLPNGTSVFLNRNTRVAYAFDENTNTHEVSLKGEAYFNIRKSEKENFVVDAGGVFIRDIGTSFNVKAPVGSDEVEVLVEEGEVRFFTEENTGITLKAGGKGVYNKKTGAFTIEQPDPNITSYKTRFFVFSSTDLKTVAEALNKVYKKQLVVPAHLEHCMITVSFREESIEEIAVVITETLGLTSSEDNNQIVLAGDGCQ